jgi:hypothetical protein
MTSMFQIPAMGSPFASVPFLGQVPLAGPSDVVRRPSPDGIRVYCDPAVDPTCSDPYEGPIPVTLQGNDTAVNASGRRGNLETPPISNCNVEWDPGCPRPKPTRTMSPYVPSSYMRGADGAVRVGSIEYHGTMVGRRARKT